MNRLEHDMAKRLFAELACLNHQSSVARVILGIKNQVAQRQSLCNGAAGAVSLNQLNLDQIAPAMLLDSLAEFPPFLLAYFDSCQCHHLVPFILVEAARFS